jgi:hypothetical protein
MANGKDQIANGCLLILPFDICPLPFEILCGFVPSPRFVRAGLSCVKNRRVYKANSALLACVARVNLLTGVRPEINIGAGLGNPTKHYES